MLDSYKLRMNALGSYDGEFRRRNAQKIMETSWKRDAATKPVYVKWVDSGLPVVDDYDVPVYAKFNIKSYHNITGDEIAYLLQFRNEDMKNNPDIKVGSYVQIVNEIDEPEWWLIVHEDDRTQFRQFSILKCLWVYKWISKVDGKRIIHQCLGAPRNQNSYNSGVWLDYTFQVAENQHIAMLPTNDDSRTIMYDTKFLIGDEKRYPPIAWKVSKVQSSLNGSVTNFTMTQEQFDAAKDNAELMIANYYDSVVEPNDTIIEEEKPVTFNLREEKSFVNTEYNIAYSGQPAIRAGGGYKKFTLKEKENGEFVDVSDTVEWFIDFDGNEDNLEQIVNGNVFKVKCVNNYSLIGKTFTVTAKTKNGTKSLIVEVISL